MPGFSIVDMVETNRGMERWMRRSQPKLEDYSNMFLPRTDEERLATMMGQAAMSACACLPPGRKRLQAFHMLRVAARRCPGAAYNLGNYLSSRKPGRPRRYELSTDVLITASNMAKERIADLKATNNKWPDSEFYLRDVGSRALTDLGARISNIGSPGEAVVYFREAIQMFAGNANAWICLGNMGFFFSKNTGVDVLEGTEAWKMAYSMGVYGSDIDGLESDRRNAVEIIDKLVSGYGRPALDQWVERRLSMLLDKRQKGLIELKPLVMHPEDLGRVTGKPFSSAATFAAASLGTILADEVATKLALEEKVTIAASLLLSFLNRTAKSDAEKRLAVSSAMSLCDSFEPLRPFIGDEEWVSVGPPKTEYLLSPAAKAHYRRIVSLLIDSVLQQQPKTRAVDAAAAVLFHLDAGFRRGVTSMIAPKVGRMNDPVEYLPALYVGGVDTVPPGLRQ